METFEVYFVRNKEGKYFRAKGLGGYGQTWVEDIKRAKLYTKIGQARSRVTYFKNEWPEFGTPDIISMQLKNPKVLDETARVKKVAEAKQKREAKNEAFRRKRELQTAQAAFEAAKERFEEISGVAPIKDRQYTLAMCNLKNNAGDPTQVRVAFALWNNEKAIVWRYAEDLSPIILKHLQHLERMPIETFENYLKANDEFAPVSISTMLIATPNRDLESVANSMTTIIFERR